MKGSRPIAGGSKAIERSIEKHIELTNKYVSEGLPHDIASKRAFNEILSDGEAK